MTEPFFQTAEGIWVSGRLVSKNPFKAITAIQKWNITDMPDLCQMMEVSTNYLIYSFHNRLSLTHNSIRSTQCRFQNRLKLNTNEHIEGNSFLRDLGDSIALTKCRQITVPLATNITLCYQDIKLGNNLGYLDSCLLYTSPSPRD